MLLNLKFEIPQYQYIGEENKKMEDIDFKKDYKKVIFSSLDERINKHQGVFIFPDLNLNHILEENGIEIFEAYKLYSEAHNIYNYREEKGLKWISLGLIVESLKMAYFGKEKDQDFLENGVCDNYEQILKEMPYLETSENNYIITMCPIRKEHQPPNGGWRWHKWGEYIGEQDSVAEYLYDEPEIDVVYVFHVYKILNKNIEEEYKLAIYEEKVDI